MTSIPRSIEVLHEGYSASCVYGVTNEQPRIFARYLARHNIRPKRVLSICSGGEMPLLVLLPRSEEVLAVDHSKDALMFAMAKIEVIRQVGLKRWQAARPYEMRSLFSEVLGEDHPAVKQANLINHQDFNGAWRGRYPRLYCEESLKRLERLRFLHGDISDAAPHGPFDLIYISNALEHGMRPELTKRTYEGGKSPWQLRLESYLEMLSPGGILLLTSGGSSCPPGWKTHGGTVLKKPQIGSGSCWNYVVIKK